jgi:hypothetical protein
VQDRFKLKEDDRKEQALKAMVLGWEATQPGRQQKGKVSRCDGTDPGPGGMLKRLGCRFSLSGDGGGVQALREKYEAEFGAVPADMSHITPPRPGLNIPVLSDAHLSQVHSFLRLPFPLPSPSGVHGKGCASGTWTRAAPSGRLPARASK